MDNTTTTILLLSLLTGLFLAIGQMLGGNTGMWIAFGFAVLTNIGSYWFSDSLVIAAFRARRVGPDEAPQLHQIVQNLAQYAALPMPKVYVVNSDAPNAFATGRSPSNAAVAVTTGLMRILSPNELAGVVAHELAHIQNYDTLIGAIVAIIAGTITMLTNFARYTGVRHTDQTGKENEGNIILTLLLIILAPIAALLIRMAISRTREYAADARGAAISGQPLALASALRKLDTVNKSTYMYAAESNPTAVHMLIINPLKGFTLANLFSTHPPTAERIRRLEAMRI